MTYKMQYASLISRLTELLLPRTCHVCGSRLSVSEVDICGSCLVAMPLTDTWLTPNDNVMRNIYAGLLPIQKAAAIYQYHREGPSASLIAAIKYFGYSSVGERMGHIMSQHLTDLGFFDDIDIAIPVPLTRSRKQKRGYNQSEWIARGLCAEAHVPVITNAVKRTHFEGSQTQLTRHERIENVQGVFSCTRPELLRGKHILIVDDVVTTGSSTIELAKAILHDVPDATFSVASLCLAGKHID